MMSGGAVSAAAYWDKMEFLSEANFSNEMRAVSSMSAWAILFACCYCWNLGESSI